MRFNTDKCKVMHMGRNNASHPYILNGKTLNNTGMEKNLGILVNSKLSCRNQCQAAAAKAYRIMGCIKSGIDARDETIVLPLYKSLVRPHMEYCAQSCAPVNKADIAELERVQRRGGQLK